MNDETNRLKALLESYLAGPLPGEGGAEADSLFKAMRYTLEAPGKRVRPILLLLACKAVYGSENEALPYAGAIELIHNYSLIHDDLPAMDNDDLRRGRPTNHKVFGEAMAILAGDGLLSAAFELVQRDYLYYINESEPLARRLRAGAAIFEGCGCGGMVAGQAADIGAVDKDIEAELLDFIHANKTAALIRAAVVAGACVGGGDETAIQRMSEYGENLGLAFQIADDILDYEDDEDRASYPAIHGIEAARARLAELTEKAVSAAESAENTDGIYIKMLIDMARSLEQRVE